MANFEFPWERQARHGCEMPEGLSLPEQAAYTTIRNIYSAFHNDIITVEIAGAEKAKVRRALALAMAQLENQERLARAQAKRFKETEEAATACRKNPTAETAIRLCNVLDGLEVKVDA